MSDYTGLPICDATGLPTTVDRFDVAFLWKSAEPESRLGGVILPDVQVDVDGVYITTIVKEMSIILHLGRSMIVVE